MDSFHFFILSPFACARHGRPGLKSGPHAVFLQSQWSETVVPSCLISKLLFQRLLSEKHILGHTTAVLQQFLNIPWSPCCLLLTSNSSVGVQGRHASTDRLGYLDLPKICALRAIYLFCHFASGFVSRSFPLAVLACGLFHHGFGEPALQL